MALADQIYRRLPTFGQNAAVSAYGLWWKRLRLGGAFTEHAARFLERDSYSEERWSQWQSNATKEVLQIAASFVPYYRDAWTAEQKRAAMEGQLDEVPLLEKEPLRNDPRHFLDSRRLGDSREFAFYTSGSTGTPIASLWTADELQASMAVREIRSAGWAGVSFTRPRATFSGRMAVPDPESTGPFHRVNVAEKQIYFSPFHLSARSAKQYVDALHEHQIEWLTGYAVSFTLLARHMLDQDLKAPESLKAVITTSEKLTEPMRETMSSAYGCRVYEEYSTVENVLFASECEQGSLHVSPDIGVVEILDHKGKPCAPGEVGEVVATQTMRRYQPLIRFRLGDMACWSPKPCTCGRAMPVLEDVAGRIEDVVRGPDGRELVRFHGIFIDLEGVQEGQIVQVSLTLLRVLLVLDRSTIEVERVQQEVGATVSKRISMRLGPEVRCQVEWVDSIPRTAAGKYRAVISKLSPSPTNT